MQSATLSIDPLDERLASPNSLLSRLSDGLFVEVNWLPITQSAYLHCHRLFGNQIAVEIDRGSMVDAFHHPFCYLNEQQVEYLNAD